MKLICATFALLALSACSESYNELASAFPARGTSTAPALSPNSIVIYSQRRIGATSYHGAVKIRASRDSIEVDVGMPFMTPLSIPQSEIAGCAMTCFGPDNRNVDLLIPKTGTALQVPGTELLEWCWSHRKPMISGASERAWEYKQAPLPPISGYRDQLASRYTFDQQTELSCEGY
jgi:hypothetical protein